MKCTLKGQLYFPN